MRTNHCIHEVGGHVAQAVSRSNPTFAAVESRVRVSIIPCGFRNERNGIWVSFPRVFPYQKFHSTIFPYSCPSFNFISPYDGASGAVGRQPYYSLTFDIGTSCFKCHYFGKKNIILYHYLDLYFGAHICQVYPNL